MKNLILNLFIFTIILGLSSSGVAYAADPSLSSLAPNTLNKRFSDDLEKIDSAQYEIHASFDLYKDTNDNDSTTKLYILSKGVSDESSKVNKLAENSGSVQYFDLTTDSPTETNLDIITKDDVVFIQFPTAPNSKIKKKWIEVPLERYEEFGNALNINSIFEVALPEINSEENIKFEQLVLDLAKKHNLYSVFVDPINDGNKVRGAIRYNLVYNQAALAPYFKELKKLADPEKVKGSILSIPGFLENIDTRAFAQYIADNSYRSLWFDEKTSLPVQLVENIWLPINDGNNSFGIFSTDFMLSKINKPVNVKVPSKTISLTTALKALGLDIEVTTGSTLTPEQTNLQALIRDYENSRSKSDKAYTAYILAQAYDDLSQPENAAKYYNISASNSKKNSFDYYITSAQAEWSLGNGAKTKEYLQKALLKDPKSDLALNSYGYFLLGLTKTTAPFQDLVLAKKINEQLVSLLVDDLNLQNLYLTSVLLGDTTNAEKIKSRFDNFETGENYNLIARAFHRLGNKERTTYYSKLANDLGYIRTQRDIDFYNLNF